MEEMRAQALQHLDNIDDTKQRIEGMKVDLAERKEEIAVKDDILQHIWRAQEVYEGSAHIPLDESRESIRRLHDEIKLIEEDVVRYSFGQVKPTAQRILDYISTLPALDKRFETLLSLKTELLDKLIVSLRDNKPPATFEQAKEQVPVAPEPRDSTEAALALKRQRLATLQRDTQLLLLREARFADDVLLCRRQASDATLRVLVTALQLNVSLAAALTHSPEEEPVEKTFQAALDGAGLSYGVADPEDRWDTSVDPTELPALSADEAGRAAALATSDAVSLTVMGQPRPAMVPVVDSGADEHSLSGGAAGGGRLTAALARIEDIRRHIHELRDTFEAQSEDVAAADVSDDLINALPRSVKIRQIAELLGLQIALMSHLARLNKEVATHNRGTDAGVTQLTQQLARRAIERQAALTMDAERRTMAETLASRVAVHRRVGQLVTALSALVTGLGGVTSESPLSDVISSDAPLEAMQRVILDQHMSTKACTTFPDLLGAIRQTMVDGLRDEVGEATEALDDHVKTAADRIQQANDDLLRRETVNVETNTDRVQTGDAELQTDPEPESGAGTPNPSRPVSRVGAR